MTRITYYNLSVCIETTDYILLNHIRDFLNRNYTSRSKGFVNTKTQEVKIFASKIKDQGIYYLHTNQFIHLYNELNKIGYKFNIDEKIDKRDYKVISADFQIREGWELRDHQKPMVDFLLTNPVKSKLIPAQTGSGKTFTALYSVAKLNKRLGIIILPQFIEKWSSDIVNIHNTTSDNIMVIQGSKALSALIEMAKTDSITNDYFIFSNRTLQDYISQYEEDPDLCVDMYGCAPIDLFPMLGIGVLLIDEVHMHFHNVFRILLHTNVKYQIGLSATFLSDDYVVKRVHKITYTTNNVYENKGLDRYAYVYPISYTISDQYRRFIRVNNYGSNVYSHIAFEQSIVKNEMLTKRYINLIKTTIDDYYIEDYKEKDKLLIFVSTVNLATKLTKELSICYPEFKVNRYCEDDPYENLLESDIIVSTIISAGTGVDIPKLRVVIQTVSISSIVSNVQSLGRLRKLPDRDVKFCYLYASNIDKQKDYHLRRMELFRSRVANISVRQSRVGI